jgi:hypothetical protein
MEDERRFTLGQTGVHIGAAESSTTYDFFIVVAHPDDAEVQMGGTIAILTRAGQRALIVDLCDGEPADYAPAGVRRQQAMRAAQILRGSTLPRPAGSLYHGQHSHTPDRGPLDSPASPSHDFGHDQGLHPPRSRRGQVINRGGRVLCSLEKLMSNLDNSLSPGRARLQAALSLPEGHLYMIARTNGLARCYNR